MHIDQDFYDRIVALTEAHADVDLPLDQYLRSLLNVLESHAQGTKFERAEFLDMLAQAFDCPPYDFDQEWLAIDNSDRSPAGYEDVERTLKRQVTCLRSFSDEQVATAQIYLDSGECWNNFSVRSYLECAAAGALANSPAKPRSTALPLLTWTDIRLFLWLGQSYE